MSELRDDLLGIDGVGPSTADAVLDVLEEYQPDAYEAAEEALGYAEEGHASYAAKILRRVVD